ncbi:MAG: hypothetical protein JWN41_748 [Thermoleophilia bacterium]|nr:hypothetical protein [Thermoleophilia bacterium]
MSTDAQPHDESTLDDAADAGAPTVEGGGPGAGASAAQTLSPEARAAEHLQLLSPEARERVLASMDPAIADRVRNQLASMPERPHGDFSADVATRRRMLRQMEDRIYAAKVAAGDQVAKQLEQTAAMPAAGLGMPTAPQQFNAPPTMQPAATPGDPLDMLRQLHPAAIARAMQGERAEAWAIVLDHLDTNARAALQLYLDGSARAAIEDARARQAELSATAPALVGTIESAIARTVVPRALREHHQLLSTTPLQWAAPA